MTKKTEGKGHCICSKRSCNLVLESFLTEIINYKCIESKACVSFSKYIGISSEHLVA